MKTTVPTTEVPDELAQANFAALDSYLTISPDEIRTLLEGERRKTLRNALVWTEEQRKERLGR